LRHDISATPSQRLQSPWGQVLLLALTLEVFAVVSPFYMQWVIDNVLLSNDRELLSTLALGFLALLTLQQVINFIRAWALIYLGTTLNIQWRANVFCAHAAPAGSILRETAHR
jgi:ATP-binding cassette subfamily B protein RaxB